MASTETKKVGGWLANYYLRGLIALVVGAIALGLGVPPGMPLLIAAIAWVGLWLAAHVRAGYVAADRR